MIRPTSSEESEKVVALEKPYTSINIFLNIYPSLISGPKKALLAINELALSLEKPTLGLLREYKLALTLKKQFFKNICLTPRDNFNSLNKNLLIGLIEKGVPLNANVLS